MADRPPSIGTWVQRGSAFSSGPTLGRPARPPRTLRRRGLHALALVGLLMLPAVPTLGLGGAGGVAAAGFQCKIVFGSTPAAVLISSAAPNVTALPGDQVDFVYELQVTNYSTALAGARIRMPTPDGSFPLASGGMLQLYGLLRWFNVSNGAWSNASQGTVTHTIGTVTRLGGTANATFSTQKLAVMATVGYGQMSLAVRWHWAIRSLNGSWTNGSWSVPTSSGFHPSVLYPAPYVSLISTSGLLTTIGSMDQATLGGAISNEAFFLELEHASTGVVVRSHGLTAPSGNATPFTVWMVFNSIDEDLGPGQMLLHIHNHCGSMLYSLPSTGRFASNASLHLSTSRSACPTIDLNGTAYARGRTVTVHPSTAALPVRAPACGGHPFLGWTATGAVDPNATASASTTVVVTYNGTLTADYR